MVVADRSTPRRCVTALLTMIPLLAACDLLGGNAVDKDGNLTERGSFQRCAEAWRHAYGAETEVPRVQGGTTAWPNMLFIWSGADSVVRADGIRVGLATCRVNAFSRAVALQADGQSVL
ncbi:MAG: hypothetical protein RLY86_655 [Pseudomonadota bacterium]|jgi:hypothetical protein